MNYSEEVLRFNLMGTWFFTPEEIINKINESIRTFKGNMNAVDDVTMVALKYKPEINAEEDKSSDVEAVSENSPV